MRINAKAPCSAQPVVSYIANAGDNVISLLTFKSVEERLLQSKQIWDIENGGDAQ